MIEVLLGGCMFQKETKDLPTNLFINLYHRSLDLPQVDAYTDLNRFRSQIEVEKSGPHHKPYEAMVQHTMTYRLVFSGIGVLFLLLALLVHQHSINWFSYAIIFSSFHTAKTVVGSFCLMLSAAAFAIAYFIRIEREAKNQLIRRAKLKLRRILRKKIAASDNSNQLKHEYSIALDRMNESNETTVLLFQQIYHYHSLSPSERAILFNQSILELNDRLHQIINKFQKA